mgnify:CR=1 FL=1
MLRDAPYQYKDEDVRSIDFTGKRCILMTAHRRENLGEPMRNMFKAIKKIIDEY